MLYKDGISNHKFSVALAARSISSNTTTVGSWINMTAFDKLSFIHFTGARTDGTSTLLIEEADADNQSDAAAVADIHLLPVGTGQEASTAISAANTATKLGYVGNKKYVRASIVSTGVTTGFIGGVIAIQGSPDVAVVE